MSDGLYCSEHPRPDAYRADWLNWNGDWQFEIEHHNHGLARGLATCHDFTQVMA